MKRLIKKVFTGSAKPRSENQAGDDVPAFDRSYYADITEARLNHLKSLELPVSGKTVIDLGCGIGRLSEFFVNQGCDILCVDGRADNIKKLQELYPGRKCAVADLETQQILEYGRFDVVFCYGLLYHLADPFGLIKNAFKICEEMMIIETCVTDADEPVLRLVKEAQTAVTQAVSGMGCRPSPSYVVACLRLAGFQYVYSPLKMPKHKQFQYKRSNDFSYLKDGDLIRDIFIASHKRIQNSKLKQINF